MRYWPLSIVAHSPLLPPAYAGEVHRACATAAMSHGAFMACSDVAAHTRAVETSLVIIESVNAPMRRVYSEYPNFDEWIRLERGGFIQNDQGFFGFVLDALH